MIGLVIACGATLGLGLAGLTRSMLAHHDRGPDAVESRSFIQRSRVSTSSGLRRRLTIAAVIGIACLLVTRWPAALAIGFVAGYGLPRLFGGTGTMHSIRKIEAIATWTEMLQATLAAAAGLSQAIMATAPLAPKPIRPQTAALAARLDVGMDPREALAKFAAELNDPSADRVVCALLLATSVRAQRLGELLSALADATRQEVALRLRVETSRASVRSGVRTVMVFSVAFAGALVLMARSYLAPFGSPSGQMVLLLVAAFYGLGLTLLVTMSRPPESIRLLGEVGEP